MDQGYDDTLKAVQQLEKKIVSLLENAQEGRVRCQMIQRKYPQYFVTIKEGEADIKKERYLKKTEIDLARELVQKEYYNRLLKAARKLEKRILRRGEEPNFYDLKNVYLEFPVAKRILIKPLILSDEEYLEKWYQCGKAESNPYPIGNGFLTEKGETVRSKSEKMIADKFYLRKIPYKYEAPLKLDGRGWLYPDFTLLNLRTRKTFYLEHYGMMDDAEYCRKALEKNELYESNGIYPGDRLLFSFECSLKSINMKEIDYLIDRYLL